ncbi:hypothetical protein Val02_47410 [Virgisporangium aliadipatigenens]|uniref:HTH arsR-type domain-containing protein n=1 Tax=Virgisporangium aliadipatigenens TaxID=741659 RepID=A0A8J3YQ00_9ACTN|nr:helix-turn-helix domain-containing protein [Virgisporangium aliadipatigenens]GIJ47855.1 hypothetical protein Val02_47410 [Virgisporangium aliadipatigenens]
MATADLLLHPVRLRIVQTLLDGRPLTTAQLREELPEIPVATMYRQIAVLVDAEVLDVVDERRVRGTVERTYRLRRERVEIDAAARAAMSTEDHRRAFTVFVGGLLGDFDRYLAGEPADPTADGVTYQQAPVYLTDEEYRAMLAEIQASVTARMGHEPGPGRVRRMVSLVSVPTGPR